MPQSPFGTRLDWVAGLSVQNNADNIRKTSIICTIGPKTNSVSSIINLRKAGLNIVRLNFSHGSYEYHGSVIKNVRDSFLEHPGRPVAIALDTKGPEIRTGRTKDDAEIAVAEGHEMVLTTDAGRAADGDAQVMYIDYKRLPQATAVGRNIFVDDGNLRLLVTEVGADHVRVRVLNNWKLNSNKGVNLPMTVVDLPALSERDKRDINFAIDQGLDMIFASFIRKASDIAEIRAVLGERGKNIKVIAKIESHEGVENFNEILEVVDGIMVARGDLGQEIPAEKVFVAQKMMIARCNMVGKPVICATQMLDTMTYNPRPTRAEVSDVSNAVLDGADCVMLSGETAKGAYPVETVDMMSRICCEAENSIFYSTLFNELRAVTPGPVGTSEALAQSAVNACFAEEAKAIVVLTTSGNTARLVAKYRPRVPIITVTRFPQVARQCHLYRGCYPYVYERTPGSQPTSSNVSPSTPTLPVDLWQEDVDRRLMWGIDEAIKHGIIKKGDPLVCLQGWRGGSGHTSVMRIVKAAEAWYPGQH